MVMVGRLDWTTIEFQDNQPVIDLVSKKPRGLLIQLEEQGLLGRRANNKALLQVGWSALSSAFGGNIKYIDGPCAAVHAHFYLLCSAII